MIIAVADGALELDLVVELELELELEVSVSVSSRSEFEPEPELESVGLDEDENSEVEVVDLEVVVDLLVEEVTVVTSEPPGRPPLLQDPLRSEQSQVPGVVSVPHQMTPLPQALHAPVQVLPEPHISSVS